MIVVRTDGTRRCSSAWMISGKRAVATSRIAICTESQERIRMLTKRRTPTSVMVRSQKNKWKEESGFPDFEKSTVTATNTNGSATNERLSVNAIPRFDNTFASKRN